MLGVPCVIRLTYIAIPVSSVSILPYRKGDTQAKGSALWFVHGKSRLADIEQYSVYRMVLVWALLFWFGLVLGGGNSIESPEKKKMNVYILLLIHIHRKQD